MKKIYIKPEFEIVKIQYRASLLEGSMTTTVSEDSYTGGGIFSHGDDSDWE